MQKRKSFFGVFLIFFILSILLFTLSRAGLLNGLTGFLQSATVPLQRAVFGLAHTDSKGEVSKLREDNIQLAAQIVEQKEQESEIEALRDQFETSNPSPRTLLPASVIGSSDNSLTIDKGQEDKVKKGDVVVIKDNLIGSVEKISQHALVVNIITADNTSFTAKTLKTGSTGVVKSQGAKLIFDNVVLSDKLEKGDLIITKGDIDEKSLGFPPDLVVGKIISINKKASSLFQSAEVESLVDFGRLETVFVITQ